MKKKLYKFILLMVGLGILQSCFKQTEPKYFYEPAIGWKIQLSRFFSFKNPKEMNLSEGIYTRKNQKIEKTPGETTLLFKNSGYSSDLFRANLTYLGNQGKSSWFPIYKNFIYGTLEDEEKNGLKIDSLTDYVIIDNQKFERFTINLKDPNMRTAQYIIYHTKRKGFDLMVEMQSTNKIILRDFKKSMSSSKFINPTEK